MPMISLLESLNETLRTITPWVVLLIGGVLTAYAPHHRIHVQLRIKDRKLTEARGRRMLGFVRWSAAAMCGLGLVLLVIEFLAAMQG